MVNDLERFLLEYVRKHGDSVDNAAASTFLANSAAEAALVEQEATGEFSSEHQTTFGPVTKHIDYATTDSTGAPVLPVTYDTLNSGTPTTIPAHDSIVNDPPVHDSTATNDLVTAHDSLVNTPPIEEVPPVVPLPATDGIGG